MRLEALFRGQDFDLGAALRRLKQEAQRLGLAFGDRKMTYNSRNAQILGKWAEAQGKGAAFHLKTFQAYFVHGQNIARASRLLTICAAIDLPTQAAAAALEDPRYAAAVDQDWQHCRANRITAAPTFVAGGRRLVGAHPYGAIEKLVLAAGAARRSQSR
jgi:predicted DsbA family dithiol-disulfide isomerase